jgi:hypothetical protein
MTYTTHVFTMPFLLFNIQNVLHFAMKTNRGDKHTVNSYHLFFMQFFHNHAHASLTHTQKNLKYATQ